MTLKWHGGHGRELVTLCSPRCEENAGFFIHSVGVGGCRKPLSLHLPVMLGFAQTANGRVGRDLPLAGLRGGLAEVGCSGSWHSAVLRGPPLMDGQAACTDHPAVAEVLKHVPVNSTLGSELRKEQSPGNGPQWH